MWIKNRLENYSYKVVVTDGFHIKKYFKAIKNVKNPSCIKKIERLIKSNNREEAMRYMSEICSDIEENSAGNRCCKILTHRYKQYIMVLRVFLVPSLKNKDMVKCFHNKF